LDWLALIPPMVALALVILTRRVILSLALAIVTGSFILKGLSLAGFVAAINYLAGAVSEKGNAYTLSFLILFGALAELIKVSGGIAGFTNIVGRWVKSERGILLVGWAMLPFTFFDNSFRILSVGAMLEPLMEKVKGSKEKLAFVITITTGQAIVLIPLATAYVGYMVSLVRANMPENAMFTPYDVFLRSLFWNIYSPVMLVLSLAVTIWGLRYGKVRLEAVGGGAEELTKIHLEYEKYINELPSEYPARVGNLVLPVIILLCGTVFFFWWTGKAGAGSFLGALGKADFSVAIMAGTFLALIISVLLYWLQGISLTEIESHVIKGGQAVLSLLVILVLSWTLSRIVQDLGFTRYVTSNFAGSMPTWAVPTTIFLSGAAISYVIGSSWATWALLMPMAAGFAQVGGMNPAVLFGAVWAGGSVGDSTSPLSDIPILVSSVMKIPIAQYSSGAMPFALGGIFISTLIYIVVSFPA